MVESIGRFDVLNVPRDMDGRTGRIAARFADVEWACRMLALLAEIEKDALLKETIDGILAELARQAKAARKERNHLQVVKKEDQK